MEQPVSENDSQHNSMGQNKGMKSMWEEGASAKKKWVLAIETQLWWNSRYENSLNEGRCLKIIHI
jgi:hypothetical protein